MQPTKKMGCPATINVVHIVKFPEYKVRHLIHSVRSVIFVTTTLSALRY